MDRVGIDEVAASLQQTLGDLSGQVGDTASLTQGVGAERLSQGGNAEPLSQGVSVGSLDALGDTDPS
jgi:hypothetical protein